MWSNLSKKDLTLLGLILLLGLCLRIYLSNDQFLHPWDERYHALVAKHVMTDPLRPTLYAEAPLPYDYKEWSGNHVWLHKPPLPLWLMALSLKCFGISEFPVRIPSILLSVLSIYFTFLIGTLLFNKTTGLWASFFHAINGLLIELCAGRVATDHYDTIFLVFIEAAILLAVLNTRSKKWLYPALAGLACGLAILTKWLPALIVVPVWMALNASGGKKILLKELTILILVTCAVALPWQLYIFSNFPNEASRESQLNLLHFTTTLDEQGGPWYYYLDKIRINYSEIVYIPLALFIYLLFKSPQHKKNAGALLIWVLVPVIFFSFSATKMQGYISFAAPALFIMCAYSIGFFKNEIQTKNKVKAIICGLYLAAAILLPVRYCLERMKAFDDYERYPAWAAKLHELKASGRYENRKILFFQVKHPVEMMFYINCVAYEKDSLSADEKLRALQQGYTLVKNPFPGL